MKKDEQKHKEILSFIKVIRESFHDSVIVYRFGGCYGFHKILKQIYPSAQPYYFNDNDSHVYTKIGTRYYDIKGEQFACDGCPDCKPPKRIPKNMIPYWETCAYGQRLEEMLSKWKEAKGT